VGELVGSKDFLKQVAAISDPAVKRKKAEALRRLLDYTAKQIQKENEDVLDYSGSEMKDVIVATEKQAALQEVLGEYEPLVDSLLKDAAGAAPESRPALPSPAGKP
jgi:hypothetical protein